MVKKAAGRKVSRAKRRGGQLRVIAAALTLSLASAGAALALWGPKRDTVSARLASPPTAAAVAPAPIQAQNAFSPSAPAKEYVYAGGRLVATEEPAGAGPTPLLDQTISFEQPPDKTYGNPPFMPAASSSSGLPVSFTLASGPASVSGNLVTITGAGVVAVRAEQAGGSGYKTAAPVTRSFMVAKATAVVSLGNLTGHVYNGGVKSATVTTSPAGLPVTVTYSQGGVGVNAPFDAGSYDVSAVVNNPNYSGSATGTLTIAKAAATLTLGGLTGQVYDGTPKSATVTTTPAGLSSVSLTYNGSATAPTNAGSYGVTATLVNQNYAAAAVAGTLSIGKATPAVTWNNPADVTIFTWLGPAQLNATADVPGTFAYTPPAGTRLEFGNNQPLSVNFTPDDTANYNGASATVHINVVHCPGDFAVFHASPEVIAAGASSNLSWSLPYATGVTISGLPGPFGTSGSRTVTPAASALYTLTATGAGVCPTFTKSVGVWIRPCPTEAGTSFGVSDGSVGSHTVTVGNSMTIRRGETALLSWQSENATGVVIVDDGPPCVPASDDFCHQVYSGLQTGGAVTVEPAETTVYTLSVQGPSGCPPIVRQVTVEVSGAAEECSPGAYFTVLQPSPPWMTNRSGGTTPPGENDEGYTLSWSVPNATSVTITGSGGVNYGSFGQLGEIGIGITCDTFILSAQFEASASCPPLFLQATSPSCVNPQ